MHMKRYCLMLVGVVLFCAGLFTSCGLPSKAASAKRNTVENEAIPPGFGSKDDILICVLTGIRAYDKYMIKHVKAEYHGKYEFVLRTDLDSVKYLDTNMYRYVFDVDKSRSDNVFFDTSTNTYTGSTTSSDYYILDRVTDIKYSSVVQSSFFARLIQGYMIALERERLKYQ